MQSITHHSTQHSLFGGIACGMGAGALWGLVFLAPELVSSFSPLELAIGRYLAYGVIATALILPRWKALVKNLRRQDWLTLCWLALAGNTVYYILLSNAVQLSGIALTSLVIGFLPVVVTVIGSRDHDAVPLRKLTLSLLCCAAGALCIGWQALAVPSAESLASQIIGLLCAIGSLIAWTCFTVGNSRALSRLTHVSPHDWNLLTGVVTGAQTLLLIPVAVVLHSSDHGNDEWLQFAGVVIGVAVFASIAGNALWNRMSRMLPLTLVGQMMLFETLFALIYGFIWEARFPTMLETIAFVLVSLSVIFCVKAHRPPAEKPRYLKRILSFAAGCLPPPNSHAPL
jgi:drug/metabolite transporter (DMT)-like permease